MKALIDFLGTIQTFPKPWVAWIYLLILANMIFPLVFVGTTEGKVVLGAFLFSIGFQTAIFSAKGFVRLLGDWPHRLGPDGILALDPTRPRPSGQSLQVLAPRNHCPGESVAAHRRD